MLVFIATLLTIIIILMEFHIYSMQLSKCISGLCEIAKKRYIQKILSIYEDQREMCQDPYMLLENQFCPILDAADFPNLAYPDIYHYLVHSTSAYTKEELKAYKSLEAYNYFISGWVSNVKCFKVYVGIDKKCNYIIKSNVSRGGWG